jgi:hypothetical protein
MTRLVEFLFYLREHIHTGGYGIMEQAINGMFCCMNNYVIELSVGCGIYFDNNIFA